MHLAAQLPTITVIACNAAAVIFHYTAIVKQNKTEKLLATAVT
jgi:hypothetical protein